MGAASLVSPWLRRGLEAGTIAALVAIVTLLGAAGGSEAGRVAGGVLSLGPMLVGLGASQVMTPLGFGRRAAAIGTTASATFAVAMLVLSSRLG